MSYKPTVDVKTYENHHQGSKAMGRFGRERVIAPLASNYVGALNKGGLPAVGTGAAFGVASGLGAYILSKLFSQQGHKLPLWKAIGGGALGGAAATYGLSKAFQSGQNFQQLKRASASGGELNFVLSSLEGTNDVDNMTRAHLKNLVHSLPSREVGTLARMIRMSGGGGIGFLVARYLLKLNIGGSILMGLLGSSLSGSSQPRNAFGQMHF